MAAVMTGSTQEDYAKMMLGGGRSIEGNRSKTKPDSRPRTAAPKRAAKAAPKRPSKTAKRSIRSGSKRG
jgi:hypothetical protein